MRASDADRQRAIAELRRHCAAGRLDVDEFAARIDAVHAAVTIEDLEAIRADLPMMRVAEPSGVGGVWAAGGPMPPAGRPGDEGADGPAGRLAAVIIAVVTVAVVLGALGLALASEWGWALMLLVGWAVGVVQGRLGGGRLSTLRRHR